MKCEELFYSIYRRQPQLSFCPYRVCPLGAHIDHQNGIINGFALDKGVSIAYGAKENGVIELVSVNFEKRVQFHISDVPSKENDWADYLRGAALVLSGHYNLSRGICGVIEGSLPIGGLSSSAAVIISFMKALCSVNNVKLTEREFIEYARMAENTYVGVMCGKLDQSCEVLSKKNGMLYLDCADDSYRIIPTKNNNFVFGIFFSGLTRSLANSQYNNRVDECKAAAFILSYYMGARSKSFKEITLRDIPEDVFRKYKEKLPLEFQLRCEHFYSEMNRAVKGAEYWTCGDLVSYGNLVNRSGESSVYNYQCGSPQLISLYRIISKTNGVYGARFSGAGFKGCCMALIAPDKAEEIADVVKSDYISDYPDLANAYSFHVAKPSDGVIL